MRTTILVGLILIALGGSTLYQIRNGFFMYLVGHATYAPPLDEAAALAAFAALAAENAGLPGLTIGMAADARVECAKSLSGVQPGPDAEEAFHRFSLVLLGVGQISRSSIIPPDARRVTELRRDITVTSTEWETQTLNERNAAKLDDTIAGLIDRDAAIFVGLDLSSSYGDLDLRGMTDAMMDKGEAFQACVADLRY